MFWLRKLKKINLPHKLRQVLKYLTTKKIKTTFYEPIQLKYKTIYITQHNQVP